MLAGAQESLWPVKSGSFMLTLRDGRFLSAVCSVGTVKLLDQMKTFLETVNIPCQDEQTHTVLASALFTSLLFLFANCFHEFVQLPESVHKAIEKSS